MRITSDAELYEAVDEASDRLQAIQDYLKQRADPKGQVRFPRGFLRTAQYQRTRLRFVRNPTLRVNISYALMLSDVYAWIRLRTDLAGTARDQVAKAAVFLAGAISEALLEDALRGKVGRKKKFRDRTKYLREHGVIDETLESDLNWMWDTRNNMHLMRPEESEFDKYSDRDFDRAGQTLRGLLRALEGIPA